MSMSDKYVIDESHPMIILKAKVTCSLNKNFWMSYLNNHVFYKTMCLLWAANFWGLTTSFARLPTLSWAFTIGNISTTYIGSFTRWGIYPFLLLPHTYFYFYVCNHATLLDVTQRHRFQQSITKHSVDSHPCHAMSPCIMQCNAPLHVYVMPHM